MAVVITCEEEKGMVVNMMPILKKGGVLESVDKKMKKSLRLSEWYSHKRSY